MHISSFCNLFFIRDDFSNLFEEPDPLLEIPKNDIEVKKYIDEFCQKGFLPSWYNEKKLKDSDLKDFINLNT